MKHVLTGLFLLTTPAVAEHVKGTHYYVKGDDADARIERHAWLDWMPFGAGQFDKHEWGLGATFAASETLALFYYKAKTDEADQTVSDTNTYVQNNCAGANATPDQQSQCAAFTQQRQSFVNQTRAQAQYGLLAFMALWAGGIVEAYVGEPPKRRDVQVDWGIAPPGTLLAVWHFH